MLDSFKRAEVIHQSKKEEKNYVGRCSIKLAPEQIFHSTFSWIQHQKYMLDSLKEVYHQTFNFQQHFEC